MSEGYFITFQTCQNMNSVVDADFCPTAWSTFAIPEEHDGAYHMHLGVNSIVGADELSCTQSALTASVGEEL